MYILVKLGERPRACDCLPKRITLETPRDFGSWIEIGVVHKGKLKLFSSFFLCALSRSPLLLSKKPAVQCTGPREARRHMHVSVQGLLNVNKEPNGLNCCIVRILI